MNDLEGDLRRQLTDELDGVTVERPGIVQNAIIRGTGMKRRRRTAYVAASVVAVVAIALAIPRIVSNNSQPAVP